MAWMALRARSRTAASFLFVSCFFRRSTALFKIMLAAENQRIMEPSKYCDRGSSHGLKAIRVEVKLTSWEHLVPRWGR